MNLFSFPVKYGDAEKTCLSIVQPSDPAFTTKCIVGYLKNERAGAMPENIVYNPEFVDLFHKSVVLYTLHSEKHIAAASVQQAGFIYIADQRTSETDIVGSFEIQNGRLQAMSYQPHPDYKIISEKGLFQLPEEAEKYLLLAVTIKN